MFPIKYPAINAQQVQVPNRARNVSGSIYFSFLFLLFEFVSFDVQTLIHLRKDEKKKIREVRK